ncbi:MAG: rRNA pseudouridine synthase [Flexilinea sp.]|nr:rRNA pseudouridine synthase [Flexilinea sp.]
MEERLQKILSRCGFGSRRVCEEMISMGRVTVNGTTAELGSKADPKKDVIRVDGSILQYTEPEKVYIMLNKPRFVLSDRDSSDPRRSVFSIVENSDGLFVVGRLDFESEGLILLTNDGELANKLSHPRYGKEKEYQVLVGKRPDDKQLKAWRHGVVLEDGEKTGPALVQVSSLSGKGAWLRVVMTEGRKRQIREIGKTIGLPIVRLIRVRIGTLELGDLKSGEYKELNENQVKSLRALVSGKPRAEKQAAAYAKLGEHQKSRKPGEKSGEQKKPFKSNRGDWKKKDEKRPSKPIKKKVM